MNLICNYSVLRFLPYPETGEFVNIGLVLLANDGSFCFKISERYQRVTQFFDTLDHKIYLRARTEIKAELTRLKQFFSQNRTDLKLLLNTFQHLVQPRETMIRFSQPGTIISTNLTETLNALFEHYVNHSFANKEYEEKRLEKQLGQLLTRINIRKRYVEHRLGNDEYGARFPFVQLDDNKQAIQAIKPLYLGHSDPQKIWDHGDAWFMRIKRLRQAKYLAKDTLFVTDPPKDASQEGLMRAYKEIVAAFANIQGIRVIDTPTSEHTLLNEIQRGVSSCFN